MGYDSRCFDLAKFFLDGRVPSDVLDAMAADLAQSVQNTIEDFDDDETAVAVKRETMRKRSGAVCS